MYPWFNRLHDTYQLGDWLRCVREYTGIKLETLFGTLRILTSPVHSKTYVYRPNYNPLFVTDRPWLLLVGYEICDALLSSERGAGLRYYRQNVPSILFQKSLYH